MAFSAVLTGTGRSCNITSGSNSIVVSSAAQLIVGATIQGTGVPTGSRIGTISGTTVTMVTAAGAPSNATVTNATASLIFSSVIGSTLTISLSASGDYATPQNIYNAGFGVMQDNIATRELFFPGGLLVRWSNIVSGAVFDLLNWTLEFGSNGYWQFQESSIVGEIRGGYLVNGTQFIKTVGPTFYSNNWNNNNAGGSSMFENISGTSNQGLFRMHNMRVVVVAGSNASPSFSSSRMTMVVENLIMDYQGDSAGANAGIGAAFGTLKNSYLIKTNGSLNQTNGSNYATFDGLFYVGNYGSTPQHKFNLPQGYTLDGYSPGVLSTQFLGGFNSATLENYSNINLTSAGWGLNDLKTKYQRYGGPITLKFTRRVNLEFNDSSAANLTDVTLYIKSGTVPVINAVQAGDYNQNTQALDLVWNTAINSYRLCTSFVDTIAQVAQIRKYGYVQQSTSYSLDYASYSQPFFMLSDTSLTGISEATAAAITTAGINWTTKTITPTSNLSYDQINARIAWELAQTANSDYADPRTIVGSNLTLATGWTLVVNTGRTISAGTNLTYMYVPTVTLNGTGAITGVYASTSGTSTTWQFQSVEVGTSLVIYDGSGTTKYFQQEVTSAGTYNYYIPPGVTGTYTYAIEKYGTKRETGTFPANSGGILFYVPSYAEDVGISQTTKATVAAYTSIETLDKLYDAIAYYRLSEVGIKLGQLADRNGTAVDIGTHSLVVNQSASAVVAASSSLITIKSTALANGTKFTLITATPPKTVTANSTEVITASIEDANGDSSVTIQGGSGNFTLWKITNATSEDDYATGTNLGNVGNVTYRFLQADGYKMVIRDNTTGFRQVCSMTKGIYTKGLFFGDQVQLAQSAEVTEINTKVDIMQLDLTTVIKKENIIIGLTA